MVKRKPELLAPAGDMERLKMALHYGADAVYLSGENYGMRAASCGFSREKMAEAIDLCHQRGAAVHVTVNTLPRQWELPALPDYLCFLRDAGADAIIAADLGVIALAKKHAPQLDLHASTQMGVVNGESCRALFDMGVSRAVLARELPLEEIAEIRRSIPEEMELETFVHGAMCVSFSGRCLLSNYMTGRDANRGQCAQPCRWKYHLMEEKRPGELFEITEDGGTFILNSRDMCMIEHIPQLIEAGVSSFKIEGRMKSAYYTAVITNAYRHAIDEAAEGRPLSDIWRRETDMVSHREYCTGFFFGSPGQHYSRTDSIYFSGAEVCAIVESCTPDGQAALTQRNKFSLGDRVELLTRDGAPVPFTVTDLRDGEGLPIASAPHPVMELRMKLPRPCEPLSLLRKVK